MNSAEKRSVSPFDRGKLRRYWPVAAALVLGLVASLAVFQLAWQSNLKAADAELRTRVEQRHRSIETAIGDYEDLIGAAVAYVQGSGGRHEDSEFTAVVSKLMAPREGVRALDFAPRVSAVARGAFERAARGRGRPDSEIFDLTADGNPVRAAERDEYFPIVNAVPLQGNEMLLGFDLGSAWREALDRARDTGRLASTSPVKLMRKEAGKQDGVVVVGPVYSSAVKTSMVEERRAGLIGFVAAAFRIGDALEEILRTSTIARGFDEYMFYGPAADPANLVYVHPSRLRGREEAPPAFDRASAKPGFMRTIAFADQAWTIVSIPLSSIYSRAPRLADWETLLVGLLLTALIAVYLYDAIRRSENLRINAEALTKEIDERRRGERLLRDSEERFRMLVEQAPDAIFVYDFDQHRLIDANTSAERLFACSKEELLKSGPQPFYLPAQPDAKAVGESFAEHNRRALAGEEVAFERLIRNARGEERLCEVRLARLPSAEGRLLRASFIDITERKRFEERLRLANTLLASEIESAPDGVLVVETAPARASFNRKFAEMWNLSPDVARRREPDAILAAELAQLKDPESFRAEVMRFRSHPDAPIRRELELEDGRAFECHSGAMQSAPGEYLGRISFFRDITERKRAERELQFANTLLTTEMETSPDGVLVVDGAGKIVSFNRRFIEIWRIPPALIEARVDQPVLDAVVAQVRDPDAFLARVRYLYGHPDEEGEDEIVAKDGRVIERHSAPLKTHGGHYLGRVWFFRDVTEKRRSALLLRDEHDFTAALLDSLPGLFVLIDKAGRLVRWNENLPALTGLSNDQLRGLDAFAIIVEGERGIARTKMREAFARGVANVEFGVPAKGGEVRTVRFSGRIITSEGQRYLLAVGTDTTEAHNAEMRLRASEERFRAVSETALDAIVLIDADGRIRYWNRAAERTLGYTADEAIGKPIHEWLAPQRFRDKAIEGMKAFVATGQGPLLGKITELAATRKDGSEIPIELAINAMTLGSERFAVGVLRDISDRKRVEEELRRLAHYDNLTGLANRAVFVEALEQAIARAHRGARSFAVLYLDLDRFKNVNDTLGHPAGDALLRAVAERLQSSVREIDTVSRFGGDEFAVIEADIREPADAAILADKLVKAIGEPIIVHGNEIRSSSSIGIAVYGPDSEDAETLLSHADVALYRAKSEGRGTYRFFSDAMDAEVRARVALSAELREAIAAGQLFLLYQPQVEVETGRIAGVEALARWRHPKRGIVGPAEFIPAAEKSGLIAALGHWVMREACGQAKQWLDAGIAPPVIAVNLSDVQFKAPLELENDIAAILAETGLPAQLLELELTERVLVEASLEHNDVLLRLRKSGLRIAVDDFGTGYSSLDYLRRFSVNRIKIAHSFVPNLGIESGNAAIVRAALGLARELSLDVVVEGVETSAQFELLKACGCREVQGRYFAKPLPVPEMTALLRAGIVVPAQVDAVEVSAPA